MKTRVLSLFVTLALSSPAVSSAQTLEECLALARSHAPRLQAADASVARAEYAIREARAALSPTLRLGANFTQASEAQRLVFQLAGSPPATFKLGSASALDVRTDLQYPLTTGGRDPALVRAAEAARAAQTHNAAQARADLTLRVSQAFYRVLAAQRLQSAASEAVASARAHRATSAARVRAGVVPRLDSLQAQVDLAVRNAALVRTTEAERLARVALETEIGVTLDTSRALVEPGMPIAPPPDAADAMAQALRSRPELAAADEALQENAARLDAARAGHRPQVNLSATAQYLGPNRDEEWWNTDDPGLKTYRLFAAVGLTMPLFDGGLVRAREGEVASDRIALSARREDARLAVRREVEQALSDARVAAQLWQSDSSRVYAAREALRIAEAGYKGGTVNGTDVRDAETALADARAEEAQSLMDYWTARAAIDHATGATTKKEN